MMLQRSDLLQNKDSKRQNADGVIIFRYVSDSFVSTYGLKKPVLFSDFCDSQRLYFDDTITYARGETSEYSYQVRFEPYQIKFFVVFKTPAIV